VFRRLTKAGNWRAAEKMRSYLRAAYTAAKAARHDAAGFAFDGFTITSNPIAELDVTRPKEAAEKAADAARQRKWALSEAQLRAYWNRLVALDTPQGALMRFHLLTGGQRMEQLSRLEVGDFDRDHKTVTLRDTKGRRRVAHDHVIPLVPDAMKALASMRPAGKGKEPKGPFLFTVSSGERAAVPHTLAAAMRDLSAVMIEAREVDRTITPGAVRRTVETRLAAKGIPDEVLARLLSHGLGGVQARNYNAHHYDDEKRAALKKLRALLDPPMGKAGKLAASGSIKGQLT
jgi:integrase